MPYIVYLETNRGAFLRAHESLWFDENGKNVGSLTTTEQIKLWKEKHRATLFGGHFDLEMGYIVHRAIGAAFENKEDYLLFMLKWA